MSDPEPGNGAETSGFAGSSGGRPLPGAADGCCTSEPDVGVAPGKGPGVVAGAPSDMDEVADGPTLGGEDVRWPATFNAATTMIPQTTITLATAIATFIAGVSDDRLILPVIKPLPLGY
ncbi:hypothetical protein DC31_01900 [Microbacterium sp. CH12i]|uniref:hypothetical protein n=1 Tax=Microbacterium sp. CH12i TaxID=1479651 RepID=UPI0004618B54|nr:hypothetical protein [Microbacterium sp. CH12i]KDA05203.1 hypothetical protein DC31_01900 [Microbacterium sp. CH12i]